MRFIWLAFDRSRYQTKRSTTFACEPKVPRTSESEAPACAKKKFVGALLLLIIFPAGNSRILNQFKQLQSCYLFFVTPGTKPLLNCVR